MAAKKKKRAAKKKRSPIEASFRIDPDFKDEIREYCRDHNHKVHYKHSGGGLYFVGFVGAAIFYIQHAEGFWQGVVGLLKAMVWPAFLVYKLLG